MLFEAPEPGFEPGEGRESDALPTELQDGLYKSIHRSLKIAPVAMISVNPFCWSKSAEHDVTLTSLTADLLRSGT